MLVAAYAATAVAAAPAPEARQDVPRRGLLYEIRTGANTVYLFGTLHVGKPELYPLSRQTNLALAASERLYLEVSLTDATSVNVDTAAAAMYGDGISLGQKLPAALMEKVSARLARYQFPQELALKMKPWMLGQTLLLLEAKRRGYDPELANEFYLMDYARAAHKEILGLETLSEQFAIFDAYDLSDDSSISYRDIGVQFGLPETTVTNHLSAVRRKFRQAVLKTLRDATASDDEFRAEARALLGIEQ